MYGVRIEGVKVNERCGHEKKNCVFKKRSYTYAYGHDLTFCTKKCITRVIDKTVFFLSGKSTLPLITGRIEYT